MKSRWSVVFVVAALAFLRMTQANSDEPDKAPTSAADPMSGKEPGEVRDDNGLKMKLVWCPPGYFKMEKSIESGELVRAKDDPRGEVNDEENAGETAQEGPAKLYATKIISVKVALTRGYWLGKYEVTQSEWKLVMATEPWRDQDLTKEGDDCPATFVSWDDGVEFCRKLTELERKSGRLPAGWQYTLPTEAQWDRACRAGTTSRFSFGDDGSKLGEYAWFDENAANAGEMYAHRVGQKKPNKWGLHDMQGNVMEWCRDMLALNLPGGRDPEVVKESVLSYRVSQGGSWGGEAWRCRTTTHTGSDPSSRSCYIGFRVTLTAVPDNPDANPRTDDK